MIKSFSCDYKDFSTIYAGHYAEGFGGRIINVQVNGSSITFDIIDDTESKVTSAGQRTFPQNTPKK